MRRATNQCNAQTEFYDILCVHQPLALRGGGILAVAGRVCVVCRRWWCLRCDVVGVEVMWLVARCHAMRHLNPFDAMRFFVSCHVTCCNDFTSPGEVMRRNGTRSYSLVMRCCWLWGRSCNVIERCLCDVVNFQMMCCKQGEPMSQFCDSVLQRSIPCATKHDPVLKSTTKYQVSYSAISSLRSDTKYGPVL